MKKLILVSALAALSIGTANAATGVYGQVRADLQYAGNSDKDNSADVSMAKTRIRAGVQGGMPVTSNKALNTIYKAEIQKDFNAQDSKTLVPESKKQDDGTWKTEAVAKEAPVVWRDAYVGLSGKQFGTLTAGRMGSALGGVLFDEPPTWTGGLMAKDGDRTDKTIKYTTPAFNGIQLSGQYVIDAEKDVDPEFGVNGTYDQDGIKAGVAYQKAKTNSAVRVGTQLNVIDQVTLKGYYQMTDFEDKTLENESAYSVSAEYAVPNTPWSVYGEVDGVQNKAGKKDAKDMHTSVGGYYGFNKATTGRVYAGFSDNKDYTIGAGVTYSF